MSLKEKEKELKKNLIAEVALQLFSSRPFEAVTVDEIAREVGCGKGTIYLYFKNKDHLLTCLISRELEKLCHDIEEQCLHNADLLTAIDNYLVLQFQFFRGYNQILSSWVRRRLQNQVREEWMEDIQNKLGRKLEMAVAVFERGQEEKRLIPVESYELARLLEAIFQDATFPFVGEKSWDSDPERIISLMKLVLTRGILA
ncbi:MAG: TetR/AcrR family transcriptional regulator [Syntrophomonas sp.]|uniref:TetR/AcrR family transcriptional regulator n=1 Tax=Syntrophomonas sp. TaxID=2053627 RepID=UPI002625496A|nr:TetR/AcrR family transcriptional regulator [Syntrophomonas sp.]MDD2511269.1 TetR/AcrR family transcriptional regulator [Syntrophomonas sp.]MDD3879853.1 TetR/AcrR family transcriptional regulator [Syntrophomonas sp.]MDD4626532.1 TetR/AcrR family transcriptional regulator [Syntrophomonas sp.]